MSKEQLEILLKAFKIMEETEDENYDERKSIATVKAHVKDEYMKLVMDELIAKK